MLLTVETIVAIVVGVFAMIMGLYKFYRFIITSKMESTLKSSRMNTKLKNVEEDIHEIIEEVGEIQSKIKDIESHLHRGDIQFSELHQLVDILHETCKELNLDTKELLKLHLEKRG